MEDITEITPIILGKDMCIEITSKDDNSKIIHVTPVMSSVGATSVTIEFKILSYE